MKSLESACSFAKGIPLAFNQLEQHVQPLLGREVGVELIVGLVRIFKAAEDLNDAVHS